MADKDHPKCTGCGKPIITETRKEDDGEGRTYSEYEDEKGRCYQCSMKAKKARAA